MKNFIILFTLLTSAAFSYAQTVINLTIPPQDTKLEVSAGYDQTITAGESVQLQATASGGGSGYTFFWEPADSVVDYTAQNTQSSPADTINFIVTAWDLKACKTTDTVTINVKKYNSTLKNLSDSWLKVYPNPVNDYFYLYLKSKNKAVNVSFLSLQGKTIWQKSVTGNQLSEYRFKPAVEPGLYMLKVETENQTFTQPIVVSQN